MIKNGMNDLLAGTKKIVNKLEDHELLDRYSVASYSLDRVGL